MKRKKIKSSISKHLDYWVHWLGLGYWDIVVDFSDEIVPLENGNYRAGLCEVQWKYIRAHITFYPKSMKHFTDEDIEKIVIHELMHVFLNEMRESGIDHEERTATMLQKAFSWVKGSNE